MPDSLLRLSLRHVLRQRGRKRCAKMDGHRPGTGRTLDEPAKGALIGDESPCGAARRADSELEQSYREQTEWLNFLSRTATQMLGPMSSPQLYEFIAERIYSVAGGALVFFNEFDAWHRKTTVQQCRCTPEERHMIHRILGREPEGLTFEFSEDTRAQMLPGELVHVEGGMHELTFRRMPIPVCEFIEQEMHIGKIWAMACISEEDDILGTVAILTHDRGIVPNKKLIESVVNQAALVLKRKRAEQEVEYQALLLSRVQDAVIGADPEFAVSYWNRGATLMYGYSEAEARGKSLDELLCLPVDPDRHVKSLAAATGPPDSIRARRRDGSELIVEANVAKLTNARGYLIVHRDITERRQAEDALRRSEEKLRLAITAADLETWDWDLRTGEIAWSERCQAMFGLTFDSATPAGFFLEAIHPEDRQSVEKAFTKALENRIDWSNEFRVLWPNGTIRWITVRGRALYDEQGKALRVFGTAQDVTDAKYMEEKLHESHKMEVIGRLAGGIAHDFNNMLGPILGYADLLAVRQTDPDLKRFAETIVHSAKRAAELTSQLLGFARKGKYHLAPVDIHTVIGEVIALLEHGLVGNICVKQTCNANRSTIMGDHSQIYSALLNIALNARDAMMNGGRLVFETRIVQLEETFCGTSALEMAPGEYIAIEVSDTGVGMGQETIKHIFEPFFTTKPRGKGTGMGLASAYGTVRHHGGVISVKSELGLGSVFTVLLPLSQAPEDTGTKDALVPSTPTAARILVIDDQKDVRQVAADMLRAMGYQVHTCANGYEAIQVYSENPHNFDLVVLDMIMPGLSGIDTMRGLQKRNAEVKILLSSGYSADGEAQEILANGAIGFLQKPYNADTLSRVIQQALHSR